MKPTLLLVAAILFYSSFTFAQNKTLGVGTSTPNPNAALHVESPSGNQGFIMPRLTTAQRTATGFTSILGAADNGLMVYDTDEKILYIWNGAQWSSTQQVAQANLALSANKLSLPYVDSVTTAPTGSNLIRLVYKGSGVENVGLAQFENLNPQNGFNPLFVRNYGTNGAGYFQVINPNSTSPAVRSITNSNQANMHGILGRTTGTGGSGGWFEIVNGANATTALGATTNGTGNAGFFQSTNAANVNPALYATTNAGTTAMAIRGDINNATNASAAIYGHTNGTGVGLYGITIGTGAAIQGYTATGSTAIYGQHNGASGQAGLFSITNAANASRALRVTTIGTGSAATIESTNVNATGSALGVLMTSNVTGGAAVESISNGEKGHAGVFNIFNAANNAEAISSTTSGTGSVANFFILNSSNSSPVIDANTPGTGSVIRLQNNGNGLAIEMLKGGLKLSIATISSAGAITSNAALYNVTATGTFTLPAGAAEGTYCIVFNDSGSTISIDQLWISGTFSSFPIPNEEDKQFFYIGGKWRLSH